MNDTPPPSINETVVERFEASWLHGDPEPIDQLKLDRSDPFYLATLEELVLLELKFSWKLQAEMSENPTHLGDKMVPAGKRVELYLASFPELRCPEITLRLVRQEYLVRCQFGDRPMKQEYRERFPDIVRTGDEVDSRDAVSGRRMPPGKDTWQPGTTIDRYLLINEEGRGGFGCVWQVEDPNLGRRVALKHLRDRAAQEETLRKRFVTEARISAKLEHPGVVPVYDLGQLDEYHPYYTMKLVRGKTLGEAISQFHEEARELTASSRSVEYRQLLGAFISVCRTMEYAHAHDVLHRDLKPENIVLGDFGETIILDWGLAKVLGTKIDSDHEMQAAIALIGVDAVETQPGTAQGTPMYMSPEQAAGRTDLVDRRSDVYSLGAVLYQLLTGTMPFEGYTTNEVLAIVQEGWIVSPRSINHEVPKALEAICLKAMAKDRDDRYQNVAALTADLEHFLADEPVGAYRELWITKARRAASRHRTLVTAVGAPTCSILAYLLAFFGVHFTLRRRMRWQSWQNILATGADGPTETRACPKWAAGGLLGFHRRRCHRFRRELFATQFRQGPKGKKQAIRDRVSHGLSHCFTDGIAQMRSSAWPSMGCGRNTGYDT